jgi:hypothetical protein
VPDQDKEREATSGAYEAFKRRPIVRLLREFLPTLLLTLAGAGGAVAVSTGDAEYKAKVVKVQAERVEDKAESGYQVAVGELERLRGVVARLEGEMAAMKRALRSIGKKTSVSVTVTSPAPAPAPAAAPAPLPPTLDKALEQKPAEPPQ